MLKSPSVGENKLSLQFVELGGRAAIKHVRGELLNSDLESIRGESVELGHKR